MYTHINPMTIPEDRLNKALRHLIEIQLFPMNYSQHKISAWEALDALAPELSLLEPSEAWERVKEERV